MANNATPPPPPTRSADLVLNRDYSIDKQNPRGPYKCLYCNTFLGGCDTYSTRLNGILRHIQTALGQKNHKCSHCNRWFSQRVHCQTHERTHTRQMHTCGVEGCQFQATDASAVSRHQKKQHPAWKEQNTRNRRTRSPQTPATPTDEATQMPQQQYQQQDMQQPLHNQQDAALEQIDTAEYAPAVQVSTFMQAVGMNHAEFARQLGEFGIGTYDNPALQPGHSQDVEGSISPQNNIISFGEQQQLPQTDAEVANQQACNGWYPDHNGLQPHFGQSQNLDHIPHENHQHIDPRLLSDQSLAAPTEPEQTFSYEDFLNMVGDTDPLFDDDMFNADLDGTDFDPSGFWPDPPPL